ncbi:uncharacterized protein EKO05_0000675 [Ascochyta rabiei]|uniref:uncharacterized protein n=1 Tax=Didymella rabiei TaxID=5454 RepID=UPI002205173D|nr:uncharacterized protein EKO05_0000675 [Ascochyta rabiei]UPX09999.1 hypothetical protein EKO05_0000675 [Ascochyta rabiei]
MTDSVMTDEAPPKSQAGVGLRRFDTSKGVTLGDHDAQLGLDNSSDTMIPRPRTPMLKRVKSNWHGLPSPQTPSYTYDVSSYQSTDVLFDGHCGNKKESPRSPERRGRVRPPGTPDAVVSHFNTPFSPSTSDNAFSFESKEPSVLSQRRLRALPTLIEVDAESALEHSTQSSTRRSSRLKNKMKNQEETNSIFKPTKRVTQAPPISPQEPSQQIFTSAEPATSSFEMAIAHGDELPTLHSTDWQLMYPPGGSSHPSYPWPAADPRLVFEPHYVPLRNGLPDVSYVPGLILPMGWRQVCWSGLHPVVFDPFRQAFKLTPVGPLPLTCEEVHQGGLQNYIPGGKSHPEFGLLPQMSTFSDGSDHEVFNFEGIDWVLPWSHMKGISEIDSGLVSSIIGADMKQPTALVTSVAQPKSHYVEARDCPDHVIDLEDGWRWLKALDPNGTAAFTPTPGKTWSGTGIPMTSRKTKQPIASLMALAMKDKDTDAGNYLVKQDRKRFCSFKSVATPVHIDITLLQDVEFTIMELLCYFPSHYQWRGGGSRLSRSGMGPSDVANVINMVRCLPPASTCKASTVDGYITWRDLQEDGSRIHNEPPDMEATDYTAEHWSSLIWEAQDYPLLAIALGLQELPSGLNAGPITALIKWCRENDRIQVMLSDVPSLLREANIESPIDPSNGFDPDKGFLSLHAEVIKLDRKRVIQEKKDLHSDKERKSRKRKFG